VEAFDSLWFTGSSIYEIDVMAILRHCKKLGYEDKDIVIDAIVATNPRIESKPA
jgi:hypothetical protein